MPDTPFRHPFTVGIEEELLLVDPGSFALSASAEEILDRVSLGRDLIDHELYAGQLELRSGRQTSATHAVEALQTARAEIGRVGGQLLGVGVHPTSRFGDAVLVEEDRYRYASSLFGGLMHRTPESALHVHVGLPDERSAVRTLNGFREYLPLLSGLAAGSPYWFGSDSGLASSRASLVSAYPTRCAPPHVSSYAAYEEAVEGILGSTGLPDYTYVYWDVRLHPRYGTVELREMDAQADLRAVAALAALARGMAAAFAEGRLPVTPQAGDVLAWSGFRAARDGVDAELSVAGRRQPLVEVLDGVLGVLRQSHEFPEDDEALAELARLVEAGGTAGRQRATAGRLGLRGLLAELADLTARQPPT
ncbi:MAG TPA: YbdK family carboxylate-amine ligase [Nocardioides sp.]|jgi:carboxylate-amine ligase|nr:YbdK family carboxylate-amine ligase [Nocardioides sp.]